MSFFRTLFQVMLGDLGRAALAFYNENSTIINAVVFVYGIVIVYAHNHLRMTIKRMEKRMVEIANGLGENPEFKEVHRRFVESWRSSEKDKRLLFPSKTDLWFEMLDLTDLVDLVHIRPDYVKIALHKNIGHPEMRAFKAARFLAWSDYRHRLLIGLRSRVKDPEEIIALYEKKQKSLEKKRKSQKRKRK